MQLWHGKLNDTGKCVVCVPDFDALVKVYLQFAESYWQLDDTEYKDLIGPNLWQFCKV